jgi:hypothetical protein
MRKFVISFCALCFLTSCDATGGAGFEGSAIWNLRHLTSDKRIAYFTEKCEKYGYKKETEDMRDCVANEMRDND